MKILLVSPKMENPNGGIAVWTEQYIRGCRRNEITCDILNTAQIGRRAINGKAKRNVFDEIVRTRRIFKNLKKFLRTNEYDVVHLNSSCGTFGIIRDYIMVRKIKKKRPNIKIISHFHCDIPCQINNVVSKRYLKKLTTHSDSLLVLCEGSKNYLQKEFNKNSVKVPNFINEESITNLTKNINETIEKAFFIGRVSVEKGAKEIYDLAHLFPKIKFELGGAISKEVYAWDKPDNLTLLGLIKHEEVLHKMDEADVFMFPSHTEGFSIALMEAMARGLPSIATDVGANKDMIESFGGVVVSVSNVLEMAQALNEIQSKDVRVSMSQWCVNKVKNNYTTNAIFEKLMRLYCL